MVDWNIKFTIDSYSYSFLLFVNFILNCYSVFFFIECPARLIEFFIIVCHSHVFLGDDFHELESLLRDF